MSILFGITGAKASGKSTVAKIIRKNGIPVIDIDNLYIDILKPGNKSHREIINLIGIDIMDNNGNIDMRKLGLLICKESWIKNYVDELLEEEVENFINNILEVFSYHKINIMGLESGIIANTKICKYLNKILLIKSAESNRLTRICNNIGSDIVEKIFQIDSEIGQGGFDYTIDNNGTINELELNVLSFIKHLFPDNNSV